MVGQLATRQRSIVGERGDLVPAGERPAAKEAISSASINLKFGGNAIKSQRFAPWPCCRQEKPI
jgi:hypothetical protein